MSAEPPKPDQKIAAGDSSHNYQAARDMHVHNHETPAPTQSRLITPTNAQIAKFDPKTREILRVANDELMHLRALSYKVSARIPVWVTLLAFVVLLSIGWTLFEVARFAIALLSWK